MNTKKWTQALISLLALGALSTACRSQTGTVLPKGGGEYEVVGQGHDEQTAYANAKNEAQYTCKKQQKELVVRDSESVYQGADKDSRGEVDGGNIALAVFTGSSGKERQSDDYKVKLFVACM